MAADKSHLNCLLHSSRLFEKSVQPLWTDGLIFGEMHPGIAEKAIAAGQFFRCFT